MRLDWLVLTEGLAEKDKNMLDGDKKKFTRPKTCFF